MDFTLHVTRDDCLIISITPMTRAITELIALANVYVSVIKWGLFFKPYGYEKVYLRLNADKT